MMLLALRRHKIKYRKINLGKSVYLGGGEGRKLYSCGNIENILSVVTRNHALFIFGSSVSTGIPIWRMIDQCDMDLLTLSDCSKEGEWRAGGWHLAHDRLTSECVISMVVDVGFILGSPRKHKKYPALTPVGAGASVALKAPQVILGKMIYLVNDGNKMKFRYISESR